MHSDAASLTLESARELARQAFSWGIRGEAYAHRYLNAARDASQGVAALRPEGCSLHGEVSASSNCSAWKIAAQEVARTVDFFQGLRGLGRREVTCEGNVELTPWEQANLTGAMMNPASNQASLEAAFREIFVALSMCAPGGVTNGKQMPGPFFPTSGTLIALMRYGALVGTLPGQRFDFVDNDLDFFVIVPGSTPEVWENSFIPCVHAVLGAPMFDDSGQPVYHAPQDKSPLIASSGANWACRDATSDRPMSRTGMPAVPPHEVRLLRADYSICRRIPSEDTTLDIMEQVVYVDIVRLLHMPDDGLAGEVLGGWDRAARIPAPLILPIAQCRMQDLAVPCPNDGLQLLTLRAGYNDGSYGCNALPVVTADRCSYHPENLQLLHKGLDAEDIRALHRTALELNESGYQSFLLDHNASGCVARRLSSHGRATLTTDGRIHSSMLSSNRETDVGGDPVRLFLFRFRMFSRLAAVRLLFTPARSVSAVLKPGQWSSDFDILGVPPILAQRFEQFLKQGLELILTLRGDSEESDAAAPNWHVGELQLARPLELCAALLLEHIFSNQQRQERPAFRQFLPCDLEHGPGVVEMVRESWGPVLRMLQKVANGIHVPAPHNRLALWATLDELAHDTAFDISSESWISSYGPTQTEWHVKRAFIDHRNHYYRFSALCRLFVAQWALWGELGQIQIGSKGWQEADAFQLSGFDMITWPPYVFVEQIKQSAHSALILDWMHGSNVIHIDRVHWPQVGCVCLLIRTIFQNCVYGHAATDRRWFAWECPKFIKNGKGPWRVTGFLLGRMTAWTCALKNKRSQVSVTGEKARRQMLMNDQNYQQRFNLISCLTRFANEEAVQQAAWESISRPLPGILHSLPNPPLSDAECLRAAMRTLDSRPGSLPAVNPITRVPPASHCRRTLPLHILPRAIRLSIRRLGRASRPAPSPSKSVRCEGKENMESLRYNQQYAERAAGAFCRRPQGMWHNVSLAGPGTFCKYQSVAQLFGLQPGMRVLELGSGCGHHLHYLSRSRGIHAVGVELITDNVVWARNKFGSEVSAFCVGDVAHPAPYLRNSSFDVVLSNAVLRDLPVKDQCEAILIGLRYLAPGGCAWFGWLRFSRVEIAGTMYVNSVRRSLWSMPGCLRRLQPRRRQSKRRGLSRNGFQYGDFYFATVIEKHFFGSVEYEQSVGNGSHSLLVCRKTPPQKFLHVSPTGKL